MLLQKTFHVHQTPKETAARLANLDRYAHDLAAFRTAHLHEGVGTFEFVTPQGFHGKCELNRLPTSDRSQILFSTKSGNVEFNGLVELVSIREQLTEVQITLDYTILAPIHRMVDLITGSMDRFVNQQLEVLRACCEGGYRTEAMRRFPEAIVFPAEAQLAH